MCVTVLARHAFPEPGSCTLSKLCAPALSAGSFPGQPEVCLRGGGRLRLRRRELESGHDSSTGPDMSG